MKRELKAESIAPGIPLLQRGNSSIPYEEGTEREGRQAHNAGVLPRVTAAFPMKRELKGTRGHGPEVHARGVTAAFPMKRELKGIPPATKPPTSRP